MPAAKTKPRKSGKSANESPTGDSTAARVLTLSEAANYLRVPQSSVVELISEQGLPGRRIGPEWRFLRSALDDWLRAPMIKSSKEMLLAVAGNWKNDPHLNEILAEIYEQRGRPMLESGE